MSGPRTLPIRLVPLPGEALDSWLEAIAERLHINVFELFRATGITIRWNTAHGHKPWVRRLEPDQLASVSTATGVPAVTLAEMTLDRYAGTGLVADRSARPIGRPRWWPELTGPRFCPQCLSDNGNRWMLSWHLPFSFACTRHHTLLRDVCPACGRKHVWTRNQPPDSPYLGDLGLALPTSPPRGEASACTYPLADADTIGLDPAGPVLRTQQHVDATITDLRHARSDVADLAPLQRIIDDLHAAARAALTAVRKSTPPPEPVLTIARSLAMENGLPDHARNDRAIHVAFGTTAAHLVLAAGPSAPDPVITDWLVDYGTRGSKSGLSRLLARWDTASPELQGALLTHVGPRLSPALQLRYGTATRGPRRPQSGHGKTRAATVPSLFWRSWALRLNPDGLFDPLPYRQALSMLLQIAGNGDIDYTSAWALLGQPPASNAVCVHFTKILRRTGAWDAVLGALSQLARALDDHPAPIDYGRRRRWRRISAAALNLNAWQAECKQIGYRSSGRREHFARLRKVELLAGNHPYHLPAPLTLAPDRDGEDYTAFVFALPAQLVSHLHEQAQTLLRRLHIDEPVTWEPPFDWVDNIVWPGPHPDDVRPEQLWRLVRTGLPRSAIATRLHATPEHVHLAAVRHPQPRTRLRTPNPDTESPPFVPSERELRAYVDQGLRPGQIARLTGNNHQLVSSLLTSNGIGPPVSSQVLRTVDPAWLREQYEHRQRTFADIAADLGIPSSDLARHARKLGIAARHGVSAHKHILTDHGGPDTFASTWAVFATRGAEQRIRRLLVIPGHPDLNHAARHLGVKKASLTHQIQQLEHTVGATLLKTLPDDGGIRLTPAGQKFAQDVAPVLAVLDRTGDGDPARVSCAVEACHRPAST